MAESGFTIRIVSVNSKKAREKSLGESRELPKIGKRCEGKIARSSLFAEPQAKMDLMKAEIARKRKAKQDEFGGQKYVKKSQITAVREGKLRGEEEAEWRAKHGKGPGGPGSAAEEAKMNAEEAKLKLLQGEAEDKNAPKVRARARMSLFPDTPHPPLQCARVPPPAFGVRRSLGITFLTLNAHC